MADGSRLQKPGSKPSKADIGSSIRGGRLETKPSPNSTPIMKPKYRARASIAARKLFCDKIVSGSRDSGSWNWLVKLRIAAARVARAAVIGVAVVGIGSQ